MKIIEGIEALLGNNFTGRVDIVFGKDDPIKEYKLEVLDGKILFGNEDLKKYFVTIMVNQQPLSMYFKRIGA